MPGNFQVICGSMVSENHQLPASPETPEFMHNTPNYSIIAGSYEC